MYSPIPSVQIILSLLKQNGISRIVASPGTRNTPLVHSAENDSFFTLYSIVDERSAGFFALGLSETLDEPVCVTCTAATATCNYMPAIQEAFERNVQLIALTADQDTYPRFHMGDQNINQVDMFNRYVNYAVDVPKINNSDDRWYFNRCVNEALINLVKNGRKGPIQINFRMNYSLEELSTFTVHNLPKARKINLLEDQFNWQEYAEKLDGKKVAVVCGSNFQKDTNLIKSLKNFCYKTGAIALSDNYGNIVIEDSINPAIFADAYTDKNLKDLHPDIIIFFGNLLYSPLKFNKELFYYGCETWCISPDTRFNDGFRNTTNLFICKPEEFFNGVSKKITGQTKNTVYKEAWKNLVEQTKYPELGFTNFNAIQKFTTKLPEQAILHASVLDAIRISNYFAINDKVTHFANIGADGIDGALSTFLGQASKTNNLAFLLIGDLSLTYDMNALTSYISNNVRIVVINNYAGAEFHKNFGIERIPTINDFVAAGHSTIMKDIVSVNNDIEYIGASNDNELENGLNKLMKESARPIVLEVFTDANRDAKKLKEFWSLNRPTFTTSKGKIKNKLKKTLSDNTKNKIKKILGK